MYVNFIQVCVGRMNFSVHQMVLAYLICTCVTSLLTVLMDLMRDPKSVTSQVSVLQVIT